MKTCNVCGAQVEDDVAFCPKCGANLGAAAGAGQQYSQGAQQQYSQGAQQQFNQGAQQQFNQGAQQFNQNAQNFVNGLDRTAEYDPADINETKVVNILAYLSILFFLPLVVYPNSRVGKFHANQALIMLILSAILSVFTSVSATLAFAVGLGWPFVVLSSALGSITGLVFFAAFIFELVNIINNKVVELPLVGKIKIIK